MITLKVFSHIDECFREAFKEHHYKTESLSKKSACFVLIHEKELVAFVAVIPQVGKMHGFSGRCCAGP